MRARFQDRHPSCSTRFTIMLLAVSLIAVTVTFAPRVSADEPSAFAALFDETQAITLFAFDNESIPFTQALKLQMRSPERHSQNPVVTRGPSGSVDSWAVQFYGSVIREGGRYRMWYVAAGDDRLNRKVPRSSPWRVAYAESDDGIHWEKPKLGLVSYNGNTDNNLVLLEPRLGVVNVKVLLDSDDPDPARRYKMGAHVWFPRNDVRLGTLATYVSPDGLRWTAVNELRTQDAELSPESLLLPGLHFEPVGGLYKWDGLFHLAGQNAITAARPYHGRVVRHFVSGDFIHWAEESAVGFVRVQQHELLGPGRSREGEQNHEGLSIWNRNNVLLGIAGRWHGGKEWKDVTVDLGFVLSNDGLNFREPMHEWTFLQRGADDQWDSGGLLQGQGFENIGDQTLIYYGAWDPRNWEGSPPRGGIGIATLPRDRFGDLVIDETTLGAGNYQLPKITSSLMTKSLTVSDLQHDRLFVNVDGLNDGASLTVELLNHDLEPISGYSGTAAAIVSENGYQVPVRWNGSEMLPADVERFRIRITFLGTAANSPRLSAIYLVNESRI
ncbi:MAG: hypothetical protein KDA81_19180 [Planctomycetaceae bacterium]|nr:hypothetical protein [Planctomycetaceae bacterium]